MVMLCFSHKPQLDSFVVFSLLDSCWWHPSWLPGMGGGPKVFLNFLSRKPVDYRRWLNLFWTFLFSKNHVSIDPVAFETTN